MADEMKPVVSLMEREVDWLERHNKSLLGNGEKLVGMGLTQEQIKKQISNLHYAISKRYLNTEALKIRIKSEEGMIRIMRDRVELLERKITPVLKVVYGQKSAEEQELLDLLASLSIEEIEEAKKNIASAREEGKL